jgi:hypothetical protein
VRRRGTTLVEVLISSGLMLLALVLCGELSVMGARSSSSTTDKNQYFRSGTVALDQLGRDLIQTTAIYAPPELTSGNLLATAQAGAPLHLDELVLQSGSVRGGACVVAYRYDSVASTLSRVLYDPAYDPAVPGSQKVATDEKARILSGWVADFSVNPLNPKDHFGSYLVNVSLTVMTTPPGRNPVGPLLELDHSSSLRVLL